MTSKKKLTAKEATDRIYKIMQQVVSPEFVLKEIKKNNKKKSGGVVKKKNTNKKNKA